MGITQYLLRNAALHPDKAAIIIDDVILSYADCVEEVRKLVGGLRAIGMDSQARIGLLLTNSVEFVIAALATAELNATIVPLNSTISQRDLVTAIVTTDINFLIAGHTVLKNAYETRDAGAPLPLPRSRCISVYGDVEGCHSLNDVTSLTTDDFVLGGREVREEADYILTMTSGSTSEPKPIVFTQGTKIRRCMSAKDSYGLSEQDVILVATPLYHSISQRLIFIPLILGATCVIQRKFTTNQWISLVNKHKVTFTISVATQIKALFPAGSDNLSRIESMRCLVSCCALLDTDTKCRLAKELPCKFYECYGTSEVGVISNLSSTEPECKFLSVGKPVKGVDVKIVDHDKHIVPDGTVGEIICNSEMRFDRYFGNDEETRKSFHDGYFYTGDMGYLDTEGYLYFSGRKKEVIITGGTNVFPKDVEAVLRDHPKVKDCAVIGIPDKHFGEAVVAVIITHDGEEITARELQRFCMGRLMDVQKPLAFFFVDDFPRTSLGKVIKPKLVEKYSGYDVTATLRHVLKRPE